MRWLHILFRFSLLVMSCCCFSHFQERIPNGNNVPHPCKVNHSWSGVGHQSPSGGGARNLFGVDFQEAGLTWTSEICKQDSDADGRSNGEELGDPFCTWEVGANPLRTDNISNPGVCDPHNSDDCKAKNTFLSCDPQNSHDCPAVNNPDVRSVDLLFNDPQVPIEEWSYYCMTFDLPSDQDYHVIADEPVLDKVDMVHQIAVNGCEKRDKVQSPNPRPCDQQDRDECYAIIASWRAGTTGSCHGDRVGFRIGSSGYKRVLLQIQYKPKPDVTEYTDFSGLRLYYQPAKAGVQDLTLLITGQALLEIAPGESDVTYAGVCPTECSKQMIAKAAFVTKANIHMNHLGKSMTLEVYRGGVKVKDLINDEAYSYSTPAGYTYDPPFKLLPGDTIKTTCVYNSLSTQRYTYYGNGVSDETCFASLTLYPKDALRSDSCVSFGSTSMCELLNGSPIGQCDWMDFTDFTTNPKVFEDVIKNCNLDGACRPECDEVLRDLEKHPCLTGEAFKWIVYRLKDTIGGLQFLARLRACPVQKDKPCINECTTQQHPVFTGGQDGQMASIIPVIFISFVLTFFVLIQ